LAKQKKSKRTSPSKQRYYLYYRSSNRREKNKAKRICKAILAAAPDKQPGVAKKTIEFLQKNATHGSPGKLLEYLRVQLGHAGVKV
jgi:hypothetical protein